MSDAVGEAPPPNCLFFAAELAHPGVIRRCVALQESGVAVHLVGFRRDRFTFEMPPPWAVTALGHVRAGHYLARIGRMLTIAPRIMSMAVKHKGTSLTLARNLDMAVLALFFRCFCPAAAPITYEVLDIREVMLRQDGIGRLMRRAERFVLSRARSLVVSSPAFYTEYFRAVQEYEGPWHLVENTLAYPYKRPSAEERGHLEPGRGKSRWIVGWFGTLRDPWSIDAMSALSERIGDHVEFYIRGSSQSLGVEALHDLARRHAGVRFEGEYDASRDLQMLYASVHIMWCLDISPDGGSGEWLLPNRLYEAGYFGVPLLAMEGTATGERVQELGIGWTIADRTVDAVQQFLCNLKAAEYFAARKRALETPATVFSGSDQVNRLVRDAIQRR